MSITDWKGAVEAWLAAEAAWMNTYMAYGEGSSQEQKALKKMTKTRLELRRLVREDR